MTLYRMSLFLFFGIVQIFIGLINADTGKSVAVWIGPAGDMEMLKRFNYAGFEGFDDLIAGQFHENYETNFGGGPTSEFTGTYSNVTIESANVYGGVDGTGNYAVARSGSGYSLHVRQIGRSGLDRFALSWTSINDDNILKFYNQGKIIFKLTTQDLMKSTRNDGSCWGSPFWNHWFWGNNYNEPYAMVNILFNTLVYDEVRFEHIGVGGFESDLHAVGNSVTTTNTTAPDTTAPDTTAPDSTAPDTTTTDTTAPDSTAPDTTTTDTTAPDTTTTSTTTTSTTTMVLSATEPGTTTTTTRCSDANLLGTMTNTVIVVTTMLLIFM